MRAVSGFGKQRWPVANSPAENLFCAGTYQKILASIAKPALEKADIKFEKVVSRISCREDAHGKVRIQTRENEVLEFDHVVLTAPLGWLKKNHLDAFEPPLPPRMTEAVASLGYGCLEKVSGLDYIPVQYCKSPSIVCPERWAARGCMSFA